MTESRDLTRRGPASKIRSLCSRSRPSSLWSPHAQGKPTRKAKIRYLLGKKGMLHDKLEVFIETDITNIVQLFGVFNQATHGRGALTPLHFS
ncbi:hypothetical protein [Mesorhizobium sp. M0185]|uniref:pPIWI-associating nuclease domain-containing protein n=1 Tax=Mesorhizobium sp. M0185 TaxID=2956907 RepID=UPI003339C4B1